MIRSLLFAGAGRPDLVAKLPGTEADAVVIDLEDAVPAGDKDAARAALPRLVEGRRRPGPDPCERGRDALVRGRRRGARGAAGRRGGAAEGGGAGGGRRACRAPRRRGGAGRRAGVGARRRRGGGAAGGGGDGRLLRRRGLHRRPRWPPHAGGPGGPLRPLPRRPRRAAGRRSPPRPGRRRLPRRRRLRGRRGGGPLRSASAASSASTRARRASPTGSSAPRRRSCDGRASCSPPGSRPPPTASGRSPSTARWSIFPPSAWPATRSNGRPEMRSQLRPARLRPPRPRRRARAVPRVVRRFVGAEVLPRVEEWRPPASSRRSYERAAELGFLGMACRSATAAARRRLALRAQRGVRRRHRRPGAPPRSAPTGRLPTCPLCERGTARTLAAATDGSEILAIAMTEPSPAATSPRSPPRPPRRRRRIVDGSKTFISRAPRPPVSSPPSAPTRRAPSRPLAAGDRDEMEGLPPRSPLEKSASTGSTPPSSSSTRSGPRPQRPRRAGSRLRLPRLQPPQERMSIAIHARRSPAAPWSKRSTTCTSAAPSAPDDRLPGDPPPARRGLCRTRGGRAYLPAARELTPADPEAARGDGQAGRAGTPRSRRRGLQLFGGYGYIEETPVAMHFRDARILRIGGGTDEVQLEILAKRMGL